MTDSKQAEKIFQELNDAGFNEAYIRSLLPSWWDDRISDNPAGLSEFVLALSRNLGVDVAGLSADTPRVEFRLPGTQKLKRSIRYTEIQLTPAVSVAHSAARVAIQAIHREYKPLPPAMELRQIILDSSARYVSLRGLLKVCWEHGIPVLPISQFPDGMPKMDGLALVVKNRPAIVISKTTQFSAWLSFVLAHEMGHISNHHCQNGEMIVDESISETTFNDDAIDEQEHEADEYAIKLLSGDHDIKELSQFATSPDNLAHEAMEIQRAAAIDAGHAILRYAYQSKNWHYATAALRKLDTSGRAESDLQEPLPYELNPNAVAPEAFKFLLRVCGFRAIE